MPPVPITLTLHQSDTNVRLISETVEVEVPRCSHWARSEPDFFKRNGGRPRNKPRKDVPMLILPKAFMVPEAGILEMGLAQLQQVDICTLKALGKKCHPDQSFTVFEVTSKLRWRKVNFNKHGVNFGASRAGICYWCLAS